jgi:hypothetical protein
MARHRHHVSGLSLDLASGRATLTIVRPVTLDPVPAAVWARLVDELAGLAYDDPFDGTTASLNATCLQAAGHPPLGDPDRLPVWMHHPAITQRLLEHWRDRPRSPFVPRTDDPAPDEPVDDGGPISPGCRALGALYRACHHVMTPLEVDATPLWKIAELAPPDRSPEPAETPVVKVGHATVRMRPDGMPASKSWTRNPDLPYRYGGRTPMAPAAMPAR